MRVLVKVVQVVSASTVFTHATLAQLPSPRLIQRIDFDQVASANECVTILKLVNVGDRGSINTVPATHVTTDEKDGFDDFALFFSNRNYLSQGAKVWIYDGRSGERLRTATGALLEYALTSTEFDGTWCGMCGEGGKDLTGDGWPDLVVGAPSYIQSGFAGVGAIYVFSLRQPDPANVLRISAPNSVDRNFGASIAILGDFLGGPCAELLVGAPRTDYGGGNGFSGRAYVLDLDNSNGQTPPYVHCAIDGFNPYPNTPLDVPSSTDFGNKVALIGPIATVTSGAPAWDGFIDRTPEFAIADLLASRKNAMPGKVIYNGVVAWYNSYQLSAWPPPVMTPAQYYVGGATGNELGAFLARSGDADDPPKNTTTSPSWDLLIGGFNSERVMLTDPNAIGAALPFPAFSALTGYAVHPGLGVWQGFEGNEVGDQSSGLGDLDFDGGTEGHDEMGWVEFTGGVVGVGPPVSHLVRVVSLNATVPFANDLYQISQDPVTHLTLNGSAAVISNAFNDFGGVTSITRLGDVDGDGIDDVGVVSGFDSTNGTGHHAVALIYGSHASWGGALPTTGSVGGGASTIRLLGNQRAQRGSRIAITVTGCTPYATGTLYEDIITGPGTAACGGTLRVTASGVSFTCNAMGEYHYIRDLDYYSTNATNMPGTTWYYQAIVNTSPICTITGIRSVQIIDSSNPLDCYPGDS